MKQIWRRLAIGITFSFVLTTAFSFIVLAAEKPAAKKKQDANQKSLYEKLKWKGAPQAQGKKPNPSGPKGGAKTNLKNSPQPTAVAGGPGADPNAVPQPLRRDFDNNPPGAAGGPGTNWENSPGAAGGPGASPDRQPWPPRRNFNNPPGAAGGPGTNWQNPPGAAGGPGASPNQGNWPPQGRFRGNPPGMAGGPGTDMQNQPGQAGGPGMSQEMMQRAQVNQPWEKAADANKDGMVDRTEAMQWKQSHQGMRNNPPGMAGGPGTSPNQGNWPPRRDFDNNPPGAAGGPGTNWENPAGQAGGSGASPNQRPWPPRRQWGNNQPPAAVNNSQTATAQENQAASN